MYTDLPSSSTSASPKSVLATEMLSPRSPSGEEPDSGVGSSPPQAADVTAKTAISNAIRRIRRLPVQGLSTYYGRGGEMVQRQFCVLRKNAIADRREDGACLSSAGSRSEPQSRERRARRDEAEDRTPEEHDLELVVGLDAVRADCKGDEAYAGADHERQGRGDPLARRQQDPDEAGRHPGKADQCQRDRHLNVHAAEVPDTSCRVFPANNIWNARIDALPVHEMSDTWLRSASASSTNLHPDFGPPSYGIPFETVGRRYPKVRIDFTYAGESDHGPYPFDRRTPIEGGSDRHALMIERGTCRLYELFAADWNGGNPPGGGGASWELGLDRPP